MNTQFFLEEKNLLNTFLNKIIFNKENSFFIQTRKLDKNFHYEDNFYPKLNKIELIIRPECNQKCEYCYITQHGKELYPIEERLKKEEILNNLDIFLDFIFNKQQTFIQRWELFAGDLFYDGLFFDILDIFDKYYSKSFEQYKSLYLNKQVMILLPVNTSFSMKEENIIKLKQYINNFQNNYNIRLVLSLSTDGKYVFNTREHQISNNNENEIDEYYNKLFQLANELNFCFHPMISSSNVKNWIENYDWWIKSLSIYNNNMQVDFQPMILEVRNNDWNNESLKDYENLLIHIFNKRLEMCDNDINHLAYHIFNGDGKNNTLPKNEQYDLIIMKKHLFNKISCSIQDLLHVNLQNLSLVPCHRLTYPQFMGGKFIVKNNKIVDIEPINPTLFLNIFSINGNLLPKCFSCLYKNYCLKTCLGSSFETHGELFFPSDKTCLLLQTKYKTLIKLYFNSGLLESAFDQKIINKEELEEYMKILNFLVEENER